MVARQRLNSAMFTHHHPGAQPDAHPSVQMDDIGRKHTRRRPATCWRLSARRPDGQPDGTALRRPAQQLQPVPNNIEALSRPSIRAIAADKTGRTFVVVLLSAARYPGVELDAASSWAIDMDLPGRYQLERIARGIATEPGEVARRRRADGRARRGPRLTRSRPTNAPSLSLVSYNRVTPDVLWELKAQTLKKPPQQNLWVRFGSGRWPRLCSKASFATSAVRKPYDFLVTSFTLLLSPSTAPDESSP